MFNITCSNDKKLHHYAFIDYLRGIALLLMFIYHFNFDLDYYQFIQIDFHNNPWWLNFRTLIVTLFLWLVGVSLWLATQKGLNTKSFTKRQLLLFAASILVSISSYITFPNSYIFFGILHFIFIASLIGLLFVRLYYVNLLLGLALLFIGNVYSNSLFNHSALQWVGLMPQKPLTEDFVPFLPWFGVVLLGLFSGAFIFKHRTINALSSRVIHWGESHAQSHSQIHSQIHSKSQKFICCMGRHSLILYLIHQPIFLGILFIIKLMLSNTI